MPRKCGRPRRDSMAPDARQAIISAAEAIIREQGAEKLTVRAVTEASGLSIGTFYHYFRDRDELLMHFVRQVPFSSLALETSPALLPERICELYMALISFYAGLGQDFMKRFYTTDNKALSAYMGSGDGAFASGTVMERSEKELIQAQEAGILLPDADPHECAADICTIVKGCVFEWCLADGKMNLRGSLLRILKRYFSKLTAGRQAPAPENAG